jgi:hypothetical protein
MKAKQLPPIDQLMETFEISKHSPSGLIWKKPLNTRQKTGGIAGHKRKNNYWYVSFNYSQLLVHRVVYFMHYKTDITNHNIDHIDQDQSNNNIENLRIATHQQQQCNKKGMQNSTSIYKGVGWAKQQNKWKASICVNNKRMHIGYFENEIDAAKAYDAAAKRYHGQFAFLNNV